MPLLIVGAVTVIKPLYKLKQAFKRKESVRLIDRTLCMYRQVAQADNKRQLAPRLRIQRKAEGRLVDQ